MLLPAVPEAAAVPGQAARPRDHAATVTDGPRVASQGRQVRHQSQLRARNGRAVLVDHAAGEVLAARDCGQLQPRILWAGLRQAPDAIHDRDRLAAVVHPEVAEVRPASLVAHLEKARALGKLVLLERAVQPFQRLPVLILRQRQAVILGGGCEQPALVKAARRKLVHEGQPGLRQDRLIATAKRGLQAGDDRPVGAGAGPRRRIDRGRQRRPAVFVEAKIGERPQRVREVVEVLFGRGKIARTEVERHRLDALLDQLVAKANLERIVGVQPALHTLAVLGERRGTRAGYGLVEAHPRVDAQPAALAPTCGVEVVVQDVLREFAAAVLWVRVVQPAVYQLFERRFLVAEVGHAADNEALGREPAERVDLVPGMHEDGRRLNLLDRSEEVGFVLADFEVVKVETELVRHQGPPASGLTTLDSMRRR